VIFGGTQSREEILEGITNDRDALDNVIAMANVGAAFASIVIFEDLLAALILSSKAQIELKLTATAVSEAELLLPDTRISGLPRWAVSHST
jgi:hypothetical protein